MMVNWLSQFTLFPLSGLRFFDSRHILGINCFLIPQATHAGIRLSYYDPCRAIPIIQHVSSRRFVIGLILP